MTRLNDAVRKMGRLQLGKELAGEEVDLLMAFLNTLTDTARRSLTTQRLPAAHQGPAAGAGTRAPGNGDSFLPFRPRKP
jgi:hypothetical protein